MQSNVTGILDDLNQFPDSWVEVYNEGPSYENLSRYAIGLKKKIDKAYMLPEMEIAPGAYVIVYCDKEENGLHTSFRLESNKEGEVYLFKDEEQIQLVEHPAFPAPDIAYGLDPDTGEWGYEFIPTPGMENRGGICDANKILTCPEFSEKGGIKKSSFSLSLYIPSGMPENTEIRYTLDGSYPEKNSKRLNRNETIRIDSSTIVRARLFCEGWLSPLAVSHSYLFPDHDFDMPFVSLTLDDKHLYDKEMGIYASPYEEWRRPMNVEFFENADSESVINQVGECRISGNWSKELPLKSMAIYANKRFGEKRFDHEFFPDMRPGVTDFKSLMLRNSGNDFYECYMRDAVIQENTGNNMNLDYQAVRSCVIFINGEYKGIIHLRERSNEDNIYTHYDGLEDIDMVENFLNLKEGTMDSFNEFRDFYRKTGHTAAEYMERMDVKEYMDLHLVNLYYNNCDFPGNNMILWRPQAEGGKWRAIMKDTDYGMGLKYGLAAANPYDYETLYWLHISSFPGANNWGNQVSRTILFRNLENFQSIREEFISRALLYMGDFLNGRETLKTIEKRYNAISAEWPYHSKLYEGLEGISASSLSENIEYMKDWVKGRDIFFPHHFAEFYNLGEIAELQILQAEELKEFVDFEVNGYNLKSGEFTGYYPVGRTIDIKAESNDERVPIIGWNVEYSFKTENEEENNNVSNFYFLNLEDSDPTASLNFSYPQGLEKIILRPVLNVEDIATDLSLYVYCESQDYPIENIDVSLINQSTGKITSGKTDKDGFVEFKNLIFGNYKYEINDEDFLIKPFISGLFSLTSPTLMDVFLREKVVNPVSLLASCIKNANNKYDILLTWEMEGFGYNPKELVYTYEVYVDNKKVGETKETHFSLYGREILNCEVKIVAVSALGNSSEPVVQYLELESISGIDEIKDNEIFDERWYMLNGMKVNPTNLNKGIYLKKNSKGSFEKVIIK